MRQEQGVLLQQDPGLIAVHVHAPYRTGRRQLLLLDRLADRPITSAPGGLFQFLPGGGREGGAQPPQLSGGQRPLEPGDFRGHLLTPCGKGVAATDRGEYHQRPGSRDVPPSTHFASPVAEQQRPRSVDL